MAKIKLKYNELIYQNFGAQSHETHWQKSVGQIFDNVLVNKLCERNVIFVGYLLTKSITKKNYSKTYSGDSFVKRLTARTAGYYNVMPQEKSIKSIKDSFDKREKNIWMLPEKKKGRQEERNIQISYNRRYFINLGYICNILLHLRH